MFEIHELFHGGSQRLKNVDVSEFNWLGKSVNLQEMATTPICFKGYLSASQFPRLMSYLPIADIGRDFDQMPIETSLMFLLDENDRLRLKGEIYWQIPVVCQRCLEVFEHSFEIEIDSEIRYEDEKQPQISQHALDLVGGDDLVEASCASFVADDYISVSSLVVDWSALLEDDLILAIPMSTMHPVGLCKLKKQSLIASERNSLKNLQADEVVKPKPFEKLAELLPK